MAFRTASACGVMPPVFRPMASFFPRKSLTLCSVESARTTKKLGPRFIGATVFRSMGRENGASSLLCGRNPGRRNEGEVQCARVEPNGILDTRADTRFHNFGGRQCRHPTEDLLQGKRLRIERTANFAGADSNSHELISLASVRSIMRSAPSLIKRCLEVRQKEAALAMVHIRARRRNRPMPPPIVQVVIWTS